MIHRLQFRPAAFTPFLAFLILSWEPPAFAAAAGVTDPWSILAELRDNLASTPRTAEFTQVFQPAGFSSGDTETGHLYLSLPGCARWDYDEPSPKVFLLCEDTIYTWNPGEPAGRKYQLSDSSEPGIDLLRLDTEILRSRYQARLEKEGDDSLRIILTPKNEEQTLVEATIKTDSRRQFLQSLSYRDLEGNASRFEIGSYELLDSTGLFEPPVDILWLDQ